MPRSPALCLAVALASAAVAVAVAGCGTSDSSAGSGRPQVLTTFTVVADMVRNVGGDRIDVESITKPGAEVHGYEPTPSDLKRAAGADLVVENGLGLERWFEQFLERSEAPSVTISDGVRTIPIAGESEYAGKPNPHAWMSVANARVYVENIRKALTELDPAGKATFAENARRYTAKLERVGEFVEGELEDLPVARRVLVTCEGAFSYLARDFGMTEAYLWPVNAEQEGTPQQIASTVRIVRERRVPAVFCESTVSDKAQRQVARETGSAFGGILYVDSLSKPDGPVPTYEALLRRDAETIVAGLTGGAQ